MAADADGSIVIDTELDNDGFERDSSKFMSAIEGLTRKVDKIGSQMEQSFASLTPILSNLGAVVQGMYDDMSSRSAQAAQGAQQVAAAQNQAAQSTDRVAKSATNYDAALAKVQKQIDAQKLKLADYYKAVEDVKASTDEALKGATTDEQAAHVLEIEQIQLDGINAKYAAQLNILKQLEDEYARLLAAKAASEQPENSQAAGGASSGIGDVGNEAENAAGQSEQLRGALAGVDEELQEKPEDSDEASSGFSRLRAAMNAAGNAGINLIKGLGRLAFNGIASGIKKATSSLKAFAKQSNKTTLTSNGLVKSLTGLKRLMITRIKRMFISAIFKDVQEGLQSLARFSSEFNRAMSEIKNTSTQLSGNIAVSFGSLIQAVEPIITKLISLLSQAITYLNMFFALLSGKKTVTVAKKGQEDYAKSTEKAAGAQKELNAELYGFDELTRQSKKDEGSGGDTDAGIEYEEIPIDLPSGVTDWIDKLKSMWTSGNWRGVGETIAEGLNAGMKVVDDWINNTLRPLGVTWAGRVAEILNGLVDGLDFTLAGKTVADGLNTILDIYNTFMTTFDFEKLGTKLGDGLNGFVDSANWKLIGASFAAKWQALVDLIYGFVHRTNWANLGAGIGVSIQSWFDTINWTKLADAIITGLNGIVTAMRNTIQNINWGEIGTKLANAITTLFTTIDWGEIGGLLSDAILALLQLCMSLLADIDWYSVASSLGKGIIDMIMNIDWLQILATLGSCIISLVGGAVEALLGLIGGIAEQLADAFLSVGGDAIAGFFQGIADAMSTAATWIKEHIVDPVVNAVKDFFGIHSPSTVFADLGGDLIAGLLNGITEAWKSITEFFSNVLSGLKQSLSDAWSNIKETASQAWNNLKTSVTDAFSSAKESVIETASNLKKSLSDAWSNIKSTASTAWNNIKTTTTNTWSSIHNTVSQKWQNLKTTLKSVEWGSIGTNLVNGLKNGISNAWSGLVSKVKGLVTSLTDKVKNLFGISSPSRVWAEIGNYLDLGLAKGLDEGKKSALVAAANLANSVTDRMTPETPEIEIATNSVTTGLKNVINSLSEVAITFKSIADMLTTIGGYTPPQISTGAVIPYQTRLNTIQTTTNDSEGVVTYLAGILSELQGLSEFMRTQGNSQLGDIKVIINGREVFQTVVDENNRAITRTGKSPLRV